MIILIIILFYFIPHVITLKSSFYDNRQVSSHLPTHFCSPYFRTVTAFHSSSSLLMRHQNYSSSTYAHFLTRSFSAIHFVIAHKKMFNAKGRHEQKITRSRTGVRLAAWQMRGGGGQSDGKPEEGTRCTNGDQQNKGGDESRQQEEQRGADRAGCKWAQYRRGGEENDTVVYLKKRAICIVQEDAGRCNAVNCQADRSLCAQEWQTLKWKKKGKSYCQWPAWSV